MKAFIDIGGWNGVSTEFFLRNHPNGKDFKHFIFEPDLRHIQTLVKKGLNVIPKAAGVYNGLIDYYYPVKGTLAGGTIYKNKKTGSINPANHYQVDCIDIREFIINLKADYIVVKLNCEGAEYQIIPHIHDLKIDKYYIQWHWDKIGLSKNDHDYISSLVKWHPWEAQFKSDKFKKQFIASCDIF